MIEPTAKKSNPDGHRSHRSAWLTGALCLAGLTMLLAAAVPVVLAGTEDPLQAVAVSDVTDTGIVASATTPTAEQQQTEGEGTVSAPTTTVPEAAALPTVSAPTGTAKKDEGIVEAVHESLSYGFLASATWLDSFFGNERYEAEANQSQFRVTFDAFREGASGMDYRKPDYSLRLVLPQLRKKTRLVISGDPTVDADATKTPQGVTTPQPQPVTSKNVGAALQYYPVESRRSNFSLRAGVKLHYTKISASIGPRYRYLIPFDPWALRFTEEVIWSSGQRWQTKTGFDLERPLPGGLFFRTSLQGIWTENVPGYPYALGVVLSQPLDPTRAVSYSWISSFQTWPTNELVQEMLVFGYRQRFWKPWLFLEIDPQFRFPRDRGFEFTPGILFRIEMIIGQYGSVF